MHLFGALCGVFYSVQFVEVCPTVMHLQPLKGYDAFGTVFRTGQRFSSGSATAMVVFSGGVQQDATGIETEGEQQIVYFGVTARKRTRPAVLRNRIKRLLRESVRLVALEYQQVDKPLPFRAFVIIWNAVPACPSLLHLRIVLPAVRILMEKAVRYYGREHSTNA